MWRRDADHWRDVFVASDPDFGRLRTGTRAMPTGARNRARITLAELLRELSGYLAHVFDENADESTGLRFRARMRALDVRLRDLRQLAMPLTGSLVPVSRTLTRQVHASNTLLFYARQIARTDLHDALPARLSLRQPAMQIAQTANLVAQVVESGEPSDHLRTAEALLDAAEAELPRADTAAVTLVHALRRIDEMLVELHDASRDRWMRRMGRAGRSAEVRPLHRQQQL